MGTDPSLRRSAYFSGCVAPPPSCFPVHPNPSRFHLLGHEASDKSSRSWQKLLKRLFKEGRKSMRCSKPLSFGYDAVSYSKNFDDGCCNERSGQRFVEAGGWRMRAT